MFNILVVLLNRPFVSDGHLYSTSSSIAFDAFFKCSIAAFEIDQILQTYGQSFCFKTTPHIISYATYVSATIHTRLAAQKDRGSDAHKALRRCLDILEVQQSVCWSPRRAKHVIEALITRLGVVIDDNTQSAVEIPDLALSNLDIDAIIRTFAQPQSSTEASTRVRNRTEYSASIGSTFSQCSLPSHNNDLLNDHMIPLADIDFLYDPIFGFNGSALDDLDFGFESNII